MNFNIESPLQHNVARLFYNATMLFLLFNIRIIKVIKRRYIYGHWKKNKTFKINK